MQTTTPETQIAPLCDQCGKECVDGYQVRQYGEMDPETGCIDQWLMCTACCEADEVCQTCGDHFQGEGFLCEYCKREEDRYEAADAAYDLAEGL